MNKCKVETNNAQKVSQLPTNQKSKRLQRNEIIYVIKLEINLTTASERTYSAEALLQSITEPEIPSIDRSIYVHMCVELIYIN